MSIRECVRCSAQTQKGARCKKRTCVYSEFCNTHTKKLFDLYLKPSSIPASGSGLFTSKHIATKTRIAKYTGEIKTAAENQENPSGYGLEIPKARVLDAASTQSGIARYANDCRSVNKREKQCKGNNSRFSVSTRKGITSVWLVSTKSIPANSEIFVSYGARSYWGS